jgi:hypothetical protein
MSNETTRYMARRDWLAAALRGERPAWPAASGASAGDLLETAEAEGVTALIDQAVRTPGANWELPQKFKDALIATTRQHQVLEMLRHKELVRVLRVLTAANIPVLVLKGTALAYGTYQVPWLRPRGDTDLLLLDVEAVECCKPLLAGLDYVASKVSTRTAMSYELVFRHDTESGVAHWIDAHWKASNCAMYADALDFEQMRTDAVALPALGPHARGLSDMHALVLACMHRICNLPLGIGDRLIWLYDIHLLAKRCSPHDFDRLCDIAVEHRLAGACWDGLRETDKIFGTPLPHGILDALALAAKDERFKVRKARKRWYQEWHNLRSLPKEKRRAWIREKLFPDPAYMRELYKLDPDQGVRWAYVRRLAHGFWTTLKTLF